MTLLPIPGMDHSIQGKWIGLSAPRKFIADLMHYAKSVPSVPSQRTMRLGDVVDARRRRADGISWCAVFTKAYAIVAADRPELRRAYLPFPWPHLYEHPINVVSFSVEQRYRGEDAVFFAQVPRPESLSLVQLDAVIRHHKSTPAESIPSFRRTLMVSRLPKPLRRLIWWSGLYTDGATRAHFFGTFGISVVASLGAAGLHLLSPLTTTINYGVFQPDGTIDVRLVYDHRVVDGAPVARALAQLEDVLHTLIRDELLQGLDLEPSDDEFCRLPLIAGMPHGSTAPHLRRPR